MEYTAGPRIRCGVTLREFGASLSCHARAPKRASCATPQTLGSGPRVTGGRTVYRHLQPRVCHPRAGGDPEAAKVSRALWRWLPACAGMTVLWFTLHRHAGLGPASSQIGDDRVWRWTPHQVRGDDERIRRIPILPCSCSETSLLHLAADPRVRPEGDKGGNRHVLSRHAGPDPASSQEYRDWR